MAHNLFADSLRIYLDAWEREVAAQWDTVIRSPAVLRRIGEQISRSLESQQRIQTALNQATGRDSATDDQTARLMYLLERLEHQLGALAVRINRIEDRLHDE